MQHRADRRFPALALSGLMLMLALSACSGGGASGREPATARNRPDTAGAAAEPSPTPAPPAGFQIAQVRLGPIAESLSFQGRVTEASEVGLSVPIAARIAALHADNGQEVAEGQLLAELDVAGLQSELDDARARRDASVLRVERARGVLRARLRRSEEEITRLTAPAPLSDRLQAEGAVASARETLRRAEAELTRVANPRQAADLKVAEAAVVQAQTAARKADDDLARLRSGPDPSELRKAQNDVAAAESAHANAVEAHAVLARGPDPLGVRAAERAVAEAEANLQAARRTRVLPPVFSRSNDSRTDREARRRAEAEAENARLQQAIDVQKAELALQNALDQLAKARRLPPRAELESAARLVETTRRTLEDAQERLAKISAGPSRLEVEAAEAAAATAHAAVERALSALDELRAGPREAELLAAQSAVEAARTGVAVASARQHELLAARTADSEELRAARDRSALLQKLIDVPLEEVEAAAGEIDPRDRETAEAASLYRDALKGLAEDEQRVADAERRVETSRIVAPFAGVVTGVVTRDGETTAPGRPVLFVSRPGEPIVRAEVDGRAARRLAAGLQATVVAEQAGGAPLSATLADVAEGEAGASLTFRVAWGGARPSFGQPIQGALVVRQKDEALLVPRRAVTSVGSRRYVDVLDRTPPRRVPVELGITGDEEAEVVGDLREGQSVLVAP